MCASGCVIECRICNWEVAGSNLGLGYFAPRSTQPSIKERIGGEAVYVLCFHPSGVGKWVPAVAIRQRQVWLIPIADERVGVQVKLWGPSRTRAIPERFCGGDSLRRGAISSVCIYDLYFTWCVYRTEPKYFYRPKAIWVANHLYAPLSHLTFMCYITILMARSNRI